MVLHVITSLQVGGAEMMLKKLVTTRKYRGIDDVVVCLTDKGYVGDDLEDKSILVYYLRIGGFTTFIKGIITLFSLIKSHNPPVVQTWLYHSDFIGGLVAKLLGKKVIWNIRQTKFSSTRKSILTILIMRICAVLSYIIPNAIICAAEASRISHIRFGYQKLKFVVIPNGFVKSDLIVTSERIQELKQAYGVQHNQIIIGTVGRFHIDKDYHNLVKASAILVKKYNNLLFLMVGNNLDSRNQELVEMLKLYGVYKHYCLIGKVNNTVEFYSMMDIFCLPSAVEGFPNVLGEAMLMGIPCVATNVGDVENIIDKSGITVESGNSEKFANAMELLIIENSEYRSDLGQMGKKRIESLFMLPKVVDRYSNLYKNIVNKSICAE
uniref:glycosyltransferase n=1 Tax=Flavobacterium sp. TaxID=239 RepID=UPI004049260F